MKITFLTAIGVSLILLVGATVWEGVSDVDTSRDTAGNYTVATNAFPRNAVVDITNLENGKMVRVRVAAGLETTGLLATLSRNAAEAVDLRDNSTCRVRMSLPSDDIAFANFRLGPISLPDAADNQNRVAEATTVQRQPEPALRGATAPATTASSATAPATASAAPASTAPTIVATAPAATSTTAAPASAAPVATANVTDDVHNNIHDSVHNEAPVYTAEEKSSYPGSEEDAPEPYLAAQPQNDRYNYTDTPAYNTAAYDAPPYDAVAYDATPYDAYDEAPIYAVEVEPEPPLPYLAAESEYDAITDDTIYEIYNEAPLYTAEAEAGPSSTESVFMEDATPVYFTAENGTEYGTEYDTIYSTENSTEYGTPYGTITEHTPITENSSGTLSIIPAEERLPEATSPREVASASAPTPADRIPLANFSPFQVPLISRLEQGKSYVQVAVYSRPDYVEDEVNRIGTAYPVAIQNIGTDVNPMFRVLLGPLNQGESEAMLQRFKSIGYKDAFVRHN